MTSKSIQALYIDANNLYGGCLSRPVPFKDLKWMEKHEYESIDWASLEPFQENGQGFILEVDLTYDEKYFERDSEFPLGKSV